MTPLGYQISEASKVNIDIILNKLDEAWKEGLVAALDPLHPDAHVAVPTE